jgi:integrase
MGRLALKNVCEKRNNDKVRLYYRRKVAGKDEYIRLPDFDDPRFAEEYQRLSSPERVRQRPKLGTIAALVAEYRVAIEFQTIKSEKTRRNTIYYLSLIENDHGHRSVSGCKRSDVKKMRDQFADRPGTANNWLAVFKKLMAYAMENDWREDNPAAGLSLLDTGEHEPWPATILAQALEAADETMRLAIVSGLCSGARVSDVIIMSHDWHDGKIMQFVTSKAVGKKGKGVHVAIPMHPFWLEEIDRVPRIGQTLIYDRTGKPFSSPKAIQERMRRLMHSIGSPTYVSNGKSRLYSFHGLRKNAACYLAELGLNDSEIGAICGMTPETVRHYTKRARSLMIARNVAEKITRGDVLPSEGGRN